MQMAFLLLCLRKVHSRPVAVRKRNESHWGAAAESSVWAELDSGSAPEGCDDDKLQPKTIKELG